MNSKLFRGLIGLLFAFFGGQAFCQGEPAGGTSEFLGTWTGTLIVDSTHDNFPIRIVATMRNGDISFAQAFSEDDGKTWDEVQESATLHYHASFSRDNATFYWENFGGIWSETQVYSLSFISPTTIELVWLRHVDNVDHDHGEPWHLTGTAVLTKAPTGAVRDPSSSGAPGGKQ